MKNRFLLLTSFAMLAMWSPFLVYAEIGQVVFSIGDARFESATKTIRRGDFVEVGSVIKTGANGHVHIRFVDDAFVSVRPNSSLKIESYSFDRESPNNSQIKMTLQNGTSRLITGLAGKANKEGFRLNTPVAAIGIRGTDFVVNTSELVTKVAVQQGAIGITPLSQSCTTSSYGDCLTDQTRELIGSLSGRFLEVRGQSPAQLITPDQTKQPFALPRPEEPQVNLDGIKSVSVSGQNQLAWGRWAPGMSAPLGMELLGHNDAFVLYRTQGTTNYNQFQSSSVSFSLQDAQGFARDSNGYLSPAIISDPKLTVNFDNMKYQTQFEWTHGDQTLSLRSHGNVSDTGRFVQDRNNSNVTISGGLTNNGDGAGYLFIKRLPGDDAYGVILWRR